MHAASSPRYRIKKNKKQLTEPERIHAARQARGGMSRSQAARAGLERFARSRTAGGQAVRSERARQTRNHRHGGGMRYRDQCHAESMRKQAAAEVEALKAALVATTKAKEKLEAEALEEQRRKEAALKRRAEFVKERKRMIAQLVYEADVLEYQNKCRAQDEAPVAPAASTTPPPTAPSPPTPPPVAAGDADGVVARDPAWQTGHTERELELQRAARERAAAQQAAAQHRAETA